MMTTLACVVAFLVGLLVGLAVWHRSRSRLASESASLKEKVVSLEKEREGVAEKLDWIRKAEENMRDAFKALASDSITSSPALMAPLAANLSRTVRSNCGAGSACPAGGSA